MKKPTIAIDIDDVLAEGTLALIESVNKMYGTSLTHTDYHSVGGDFKGYYERVWKSHGLENTVRYEDLEQEMIADQSHVPLLAGAEFAVHMLAERFHIIFITARAPECEAATRRWFKQHLFDDEVELYFAGSHFDDTSMSKGGLAAKLGAELLIDDNISNCQSALDEGLQTILFGDYGWQGNVPEGMTRCRDWPAVLEHLDGTRR